MSSYSSLVISQKLKEAKIDFVSKDVLAKLLDLHNSNTIYKILERLKKAGVLTKIKKGLYLFTEGNLIDFEIANGLCKPSYISFETALNYYSILPQFPFIITSATTSKRKNYNVDGKTYEYTKITKPMYWGFVKNTNFIIATPEKALLDTVYLMTKGVRSLDFDELDLSVLNKKTLVAYIEKANNNLINKFFKEKEII